MHIRTRSAALIALALVIASCSDNGALRPVAVSAPPSFSGAPAAAAAAATAVRISEIHYDNASTDVDERIEISGPAGTSVEGWQVVLYNGSATSGASYNTRTLAGTIPSSCGARGVIVLTYPTNGIQNGGTTATGATDPDGLALVDAGGNVVEFLSYEGTFTATNGPGAGILSTDIGTRELGTEAAGQSLQRDGAGVWSEPAANTFGSCNDDGEPPPVAVVASITTEPASTTITVGATVQLTAAAFDADGAPIPGAALEWSTSDAALATVSATGLVSGVAAGEVQITATADNDVHSSSAVRVTAAPATDLPPVRFSEIHYDNFGTDAFEAIEVEGPAPTSMMGWSVVLYNGTGGAGYDTHTLSGTLSSTCDGRGVVAIAYPSNGIQNGSPDGFALVDPTGHVVEFLSYEGTFAATDGPAAGLTSTDIGVAESSSPIGQTLQRTSAGTWEGPKDGTVGACNGSTPIPVGNAITFSGRTPSDPALPVGFQDQIFASVRTPAGDVVTTPITWTTETPAVASIDEHGVMTALAAGTATLRATAGDGTTASYALPTIVATASTTARYAGNSEFGEPADADASDDFIVRHEQFALSYNRDRGTPNWVSYDLDASHFGAQDRCDCFTFDPDLPASFARYTTADYTGAGAFHGFGIDRGHLARSFDRTSGSLDNARTFLFSNIIPQASDLNQGPWAEMESFLGDQARIQNREVYIVAGVAGSRGTLKNEGKITIPAQLWKVALVLPRDRGLADVHSYADVEILAAIMPNEAGVRNVDWQSYRTTVDAVEALSGYDLLALLPDPIEIAVESGTRPPDAVVDGPYTAIAGEAIAMSAAGSSDPDADALTFAWSFGDGANGAGAEVTHGYARSGTYTVRLVATDIRGLADTAFTTVEVITPARALRQAIDLVDALQASGTLSAGNANSLRVKLDAAAAYLESSRHEDAPSLRSVLNELDAFEQSGRLSAADAASLRDLVTRVMTTLQR